VNVPWYVSIVDQYTKLQGPSALEEDSVPTRQVRMAATLALRCIELKSVKMEKPLIQNSFMIFALLVESLYNIDVSRLIRGQTDTQLCNRVQKRNIVPLDH
jgi:hypothetical protein